MFFYAGIEENGFSIMNEKRERIDFCDFGEVLTNANRFSPSIPAFFHDLVLDDRLSERCFSLCWLLSQKEMSWNCKDEDAAAGTSYARPEVLRSAQELTDAMLSAVKMECSFARRGNVIFPIYKVASIDEFLILDLSYCFVKGIRIIQCENCGRFFIPTTRSDEKYCPYTDSAGHYCRKVGFDNKQKMLPVGSVYRKVYRRCNQQKNRRIKRYASYSDGGSALIDALNSEYKKWCLRANKWKIECENGDLSLSEFENLISDISWMNVERGKQTLR